ncbi:outer membrane lipoprotein LolB [Alteromonas stellipolaris]|jgi:outer membrane lipoprotein LolB|uniref:lipoprotein insertase outer membrane protein LolB n=1 Tax=Alteromonas TaxID=226 RepID=UPI0007700268|nr:MULTISPECIES: lipoprotein insertase outer membrane protein LolB [Alteromonas]AMJ90388.1 outer membrane lipoprotein LolB [Alteromonas sp. Mac2]AMJ86527.1 outer membrane lipoprotein LolB [Alteromonas sp. Mac1]AMJ94229.1 outer membrane lipoprotein LolB [Alteromonas stellipolaris]ANB22928.1 outer membrane lipoprotein LolB [Alteromonas stellipolaris]ANB26757.1 outer membrane lipoprotein LolB [Alteromonas stellipolaris]
MIRFVFILVLVNLLISACTTLPDGPESAVNLSAQLKKVAQVDAWQLRGKIAFRQEKEGASANLLWKTDDADFHFRLTNLLGVTMVDLNVNGDKAILEAGNDVYEDADPEPLIYYTTGMDIPVEPLLSWIKGLPLADDKFTLTDKGLLNTLESNCSACKGWQVSYANYGNVATPEGNNVWLPHSINLVQPNPPSTTLKIKIYEWTLL